VKHFGKLEPEKDWHLEGPSSLEDFQKSAQKGALKIELIQLTGKIASFFSKSSMFFNWSFTKEQTISKPDTKRAVSSVSLKSK
jgi:hypothetical protein